MSSVRPLSGLVVIEIGHSIAAPYAGMILGELGAEVIAAKPSLVCCNRGAFGATGPLRERPGYAPMMQAYSGLMSLLGEDGRPPVRVSVSIVDMAAGMWSVIGILAAVQERGRTGKGGIVDA